MELNIGKVVPQKGVDYFTDEEVEEIENNAAASNTAWIRGSLYLATTSTINTALNYCLGGDDNITKLIKCIDNLGVVVLNNARESDNYISAIEYVTYNWSETSRKVGFKIPLESDNNLREVRVDMTDTANLSVYGVVDSALSISKTSELTNDSDFATNSEVGSAVASGVSAHNSSETAHADLRTLIAACIGLPTYNSSTFALTFATTSGASLVVDLPIEQMSLNYNDETNAIEFENADGTTASIPVSDFISEYVGSIGDQIQVTIESGNVIKATILDGSIGLDKLSIALQSKINAIDNKVDAVEGSTLLSAEHAAKLAGIAEGAQVNDTDVVKFTEQSLSDDEQEQARENIGALGETNPLFEDLLAYGVQFDTTVSSPTCTRLGSTTLHMTLPIHNNMRGCLLADDGSVNEYLPDDSWDESTLDGSEGQVMVEIPAHYRKFVTDGTVRQVWISEYPILGYTLVPKMYVSAYEASVNRTTTTLASVANSTADYRGGSNNTAYDDTYRSFLGRPATSISLTNFRAYARKRKSTTAEWNCMTYEAQKTIFWLFVTEYATLNSQSALNAELTSEGYKQGGLSDGPTTVSSTNWSNFNGSYPFIPCGHTDSLGNGTGQVLYEVLDETNNVTISTYANRYRGLENPFGHIWQWTDGILVDVRTDYYDGNYAGQNRVFVAQDPANFASHSTLADTYEGYEFRGLQARTTSSYIKEIIFGEYGDMMGEVVGGSSTTFFCDYNNTSVTSSSMRGVPFGGYASNGSSAGFAFSSSLYAPSSARTGFGSRLCFIPNV
ncbi:MAG: hypothetical protein SNH27_05045 [Rikenellaceae bacterium]